MKLATTAQLELIPPHLSTLGELGNWLDQKPSPFLLAYVLHGTGETERIACLNALIRRELRHQLDQHRAAYPALATRETAKKD